jgi:hypothetical protein
VHKGFKTLALVTLEGFLLVDLYFLPLVLYEFAWVLPTVDSFFDANSMVPAIAEITRDPCDLSFRIDSSLRVSLAPVAIWLSLGMTLAQTEVISRGSSRLSIQNLL